MAAAFLIDRDIDGAARPGCRPGERLIAGRVHCYDADLLLSYEAREVVRNTQPDGIDFTALPEAELYKLAHRADRRVYDTGGLDPQALKLATITATEIARRQAAANVLRAGRAA